MPPPLSANSLRELRRFPHLIDLVTTAAYTKRKKLPLDLGTFIEEEPFALVELLLFARSLEVTVVLLPDENTKK